jgi:hypothetical protein
MAAGALMEKIRAEGEGLSADSAVPCRRRPSIRNASQIIRYLKKRT